MHGTFHEQIRNKEQNENVTFSSLLHFGNVTHLTLWLIGHWCYCRF